jgi:hypothetical protein
MAIAMDGIAMVRNQFAIVGECHPVDRPVMAISSAVYSSNGFRHHRSNAILR